MFSFWKSGLELELLSKKETAVHEGEGRQIRVTKTKEEMCSHYTSTQTDRSSPERERDTLMPACRERSWKDWVPSVVRLKDRDLLWPACLYRFDEFESALSLVSPCRPVKVQHPSTIALVQVCPAAAFSGCQTALPNHVCPCHEIARLVLGKLSTWSVLFCITRVDYRKRGMLT